MLQALPKGSAKVTTIPVRQEGLCVFAHTDHNFFGSKIGLGIFRLEDGKRDAQGDAIEAIRIRPARTCRRAGHRVRRSVRVWQYPETHGGAQIGEKSASSPIRINTRRYIKIADIVSNLITPHALEVVSSADVKTEIFAQCCR